MDLKLRQIPETPNKKPSSLTNDPSRNTDLERGFMQFERGSFSGVSLRLDNQSLEKMEKLGQAPVNPSSSEFDVDLMAMLGKLSFLEDKIHRVQDVVRSIIGREGQFSVQPNELVAQQQLVTMDLTSIIIQLISTAGTLLPSMKNTLLPSNFSAGQQSGDIAAQAIASQSTISVNNTLPKNEGLSLEENKAMHYHELLKDFSDCGGEAMETIPIEDHDVKDSEDGMDGEHLPPGSYEILQLEKEEILAPHTHFCTICGKGFKRDANLRMHMRGHGDEYKTPAALAKPTRDLNSEPVLIKRYSCPFLGCKRNKEHKKFQPLKTILCVKNHYKRSHCDKSYSCSRCNIKKFSVMADLKTHEKHCGRDKWLCSCGTTFSRKDKLFGHVVLFQGHTPALHMEDQKVNGSSGQEPMKEAATGMGTIGYNFAGSSMDNASDIDIKGLDDDHGYFSPMNFDSCNFGGLDEFPRPAFDISESSFSFLLSESCNFTRKNGEASSSDRFD